MCQRKRACLRWSWLVTLFGTWVLAVWGHAHCGEPAAPATGPSAGGQAAPQSPGQALYARHCAACHGTAGDGRGAAAVFVFPRPRNFRDGKFKLVSTENSVPTPADLDGVLVRGMPGSSMPSWAHLSREDRTALIEEVYRLTADGAREKYIANLKQQQLTDEEIKAPDVQQEIAAYAKQRTTPGEISAVPSIPPADAAAIARGRELYLQQSCHSCHGEQGKGDGVKQMNDDDGTPTRPRDLTRGIYKGGHDPASLFRRVGRGMPGTPMPSAPSLTEPQVIDLVHYLRSLSTEAQRESVVLKRRQLLAKRVSQLPAGTDAKSWSAAAGQPIQTFPLWWRDDAEPGLEVQALHDGQTLAIRLSWHDVTPNTSAVLPDEFEDMAAVEIYRGASEPFLGMGAADAALDLWQWRGGRKATGEELSKLDDYPFDTPIYRELAKGQPLPDFLTARAAGNPLTDRDVTAANLAAKGFGSTTFRPRANQLVKADAAWADGRWSVVLRRPLAVPAEGGLPLAAGDALSIAVALWDGAAHDRGPQKQVSIWNDLKVE